MEKCFTGNEGHPLSPVNLGERFNVREKVITFAQAKAGLVNALIISS